MACPRNTQGRHADEQDETGHIPEVPQAHGTSRAPRATTACLDAPTSRSRHPIARGPAAAVYPHSNPLMETVGRPEPPVVAVDPRLAPTPRAALPGIEPGLDMDTQRVVLHGQHPHRGETDETLEHDRCRDVAHRSPDGEAVLDTRILAGLLCRSVQPHPARFRKPGKVLRYQLPHVAGRTVHTGRPRVLRLQADCPWVDVLTAAFRRLRALPASAG